MSNCGRPCVVSLSSTGRFSYIFGDLESADPTHTKALNDLIPRYLAAPEGFLHRHERPQFLRENILGRLPPQESSSDLVTALKVKR